MYKGVFASSGAALAILSRYRYKPLCPYKKEAVASPNHPYRRHQVHYSILGMEFFSQTRPLPCMSLSRAKQKGQGSKTTVWHMAHTPSCPWDSV